MSAMNFPVVSRREMLTRAGMGFGMLGLSGMLQSQAAASTLHHAPKAKRVIFLFMNGGPSHVDTFDPKPMLKKHEGEKPTEKTERNSKAGFKSSPFEFKAHGQSGVVMSELFPNLAKCADDLCVIRSMHTDVPNHEPGLLMMNGGNLQPIRPSLGSWVSYGLGTENQNLPGFVVLAPRKPVVGPQLWSNSFLPGAHQGMAVNTSDFAVDKLVSNLNHPSLTRPQQREQLDLLAKLNTLHAQKRENDAALDANVKAMETAFAMQAEAADAFDISKESQKTKEAYGDSAYAKGCLLARRLCERGVRFTQVYYVDKGNQPWDTHSDNDGGHRRLCADSDKATAALLTDLKQRGLLDDTLVIWSGEFGRTPFAQGDKGPKQGRDHHHSAFSTLLFGGGVKRGLMYGQSDEFGMHAIENRVHVHDLHATILHLLGLDHAKLTYRFGGRDVTLPDVHGKTVLALLA
jgi:hypothetical protein